MRALDDGAAGVEDDAADAAQCLRDGRIRQGRGLLRPCQRGHATEKKSGNQPRETSLHCFQCIGIAQAGGFIPSQVSNASRDRLFAGQAVGRLCQGAVRFFPETVDSYNRRMTVSSPLPSALHAVLRGLERAYREAGAGGSSVPSPAVPSPAVPSLDLWANLMRVVGPVGTDRRELPVILRLSKRAVRTRMSTASPAWLGRGNQDRSKRRARPPDLPWF